MASIAMGLLGGGLEGITGTIGGIFQGLGQGISMIGNPQQQAMQRIPQSSVNGGNNTILYVAGGVSLVVVLGVVVVVMKNKR